MGKGGLEPPIQIVDLARLLPELLDQLISLGEVARQVRLALGGNGHHLEEVVKIIANHASEGQ